MTATAAADVSVERPAPGRLHLDFVDGLRAVSALFVLFHHIWQFAIADPEASRPSWFEAATFLKYGTYAVAVFLVVSGFCLMLPVMQASPPELRGGVASFAKRRATRILPPYYAALALSVVLILVFKDLRAGSGTPWDITLPNFTAANTLAHLFLVHNWFGDLRWALNPPLWTVALEFQIYFVFALVYLPCWRRFGSTATVALGCTVGVVLAYTGFGGVTPWMFGLFTLGMLAAKLGTSTDPRHERFLLVPWTRWAVAGMALVVVVTLAVSGLDSRLTAFFLGESAVGLATMAGLIAMTRRQRLRPSSPLLAMRLLTLRPVRSIGRVSYSLYLIHYPLVAVVALSVVREFELSVPASFVLLAAICTPLVLAATYAFHHAFERPFLARRAGDRRAATLAAATT